MDDNTPIMVLRTEIRAAQLDVILLRKQMHFVVPCDQTGHLLFMTGTKFPF